MRWGDFDDIYKQNFNVCGGKEDLGGRREETHSTIG